MIGKNAIKINAKDEYKHALQIQLNDFPSRSDKYPMIGPPATPPMSNKVESIPDAKVVYPRESLRYKGSHR